MARWLLLIMLGTASFPALSLAPVHVVDRKWYSTEPLAHEACVAEGAAAGMTCQYGGGFAYLVYDYWQGPYYFWINCFPPWEMQAEEGVVQPPWDPAPSCILPPPDLVATFTPPDGSEFAIGDSISIGNATISNVSSVEKEESTQAAFFVSTDDVYDSSDIPLGSMYSVPPLGPNNNYLLGSPLLMLPELVPGHYYLLLQANYTSIGPEETTDNNTYAWPFEIVPAEHSDLSITMSSNRQKPITLSPGEELGVDVTLENLSDVVDYEQEVKSYVFLSEDDTLDQDDLLVATIAPQSGVAAGVKIMTAATVKIPDDTLAGDYNLLAVANPIQYLDYLAGGAPDPQEEVTTTTSCR